MIQISEIYQSIQGESSFAGRPCVFVRTTGCNLRCVWCDTEYAFFGGSAMSIQEIVSQVESHQCSLVEITGGEPLLQKEVPELAKALLEIGCTVLVETSGERDISVLDDRVIKIMDLKCPDSGECSKNRWENLAHISAKDEIKFVLKDEADYQWALDVIRQHTLEEKASLLMSTVFGELPPADVVAWILRDRLNVRFQLQLHKLVWPKDKKGV